jgi:hypothetical protein
MDPRFLAADVRRIRVLIFLVGTWSDKNRPVRDTSIDIADGQTPYRKLSPGSGKGGRSVRCSGFLGCVSVPHLKGCRWSDGRSFDIDRPGISFGSPDTGSVPSADTNIVVLRTSSSTTMIGFRRGRKSGKGLIASRGN